MKKRLFSSKGIYFSTIFIFSLICSASQCKSAQPADSMGRYREFLGFSTITQIPTVEFSLKDSFYDEVSYTIGSKSSRLVARQTASGISRSVYHNESYAYQIDENNATAWGTADHLKDLVTEEALITGRIAFFPHVARSLGRALVNVPGGWPVDLHITGDNQMRRAVIHGNVDHNFYVLSYADVGGGKVVNSWLLDGRTFRALSLAVVPSDTPQAIRNEPDWHWRGKTGHWSESAMPIGKRPTIKMTVNGIATRCILDTGTGGIVLPRSLGQDANVERIGPALVRGQFNSTTTSYGRADITVGPAELQSAVVFFGPATPGNLAVCGYDFLASFVVHLSKQVVTVTKRPGTPPLCADDCISVDDWQRTARTTIRVNNHNIDRATLDTGFDGSIMVNSSLETILHIAQTDCTSKALLAADVVIGSTSFSKVAACTAPLDNGHPAIVGSAILMSRDLTIDLGDREILFSH